MNHLFVSYSRKDAGAVSRCVEYLRQNGVDIWMDVSGAGTGIPFSTKWFDVIEEAMYHAGGAIVFRSANWENSNPCKKEFALIEQCAVPRLILDPDDADNVDAVLVKVQDFLRREVQTDRNDLRTRLFSSAFAMRSGVDPYQLIPRVSQRLPIDLLRMKQLIAAIDVKKSNPDIYPSMQRYLRFARSVTIRRACAVIGAFAVTLVCVVLLLAVPQSLKQAAETNGKSFFGMAVAGEITDLIQKDPLSAIELAQKTTDSAVTPSSYSSLFLAGARLLDTNLPSLVCTPKDTFYSNVLSEPQNRNSALYDFETPAHAGTLVITDRSTGEQWSVDAPQLPEDYAWTDDGERLVFSAGTSAYIYDAFGKGGLIRLTGNRLPIREVKFIKVNDMLFACAVTEQDTAVLWRLPLPDRIAHRQGVYYGVFTNDEIPEVVYINGKDIVIRHELTERVLTPDVRGTINAQCFDVTADGSRVALICTDNDECRIACVSLEDGSVLTDVVTGCTANAVAFQADGSAIVAAASPCAILKVDVASGRITYGDFNDRAFYNLHAYGNNWVLTDAWGIGTVFDDSLHIIRELGQLTDVATPLFDLDINTDKGYLFSVCRGGANVPGCCRITLPTGAKHRLVVPQIEKTDSTTAVAMSRDGRFVAFGYANGTVHIFETGQLTFLFEHNGIGEAVSALRFSDDNRMLYMLGSTGNLYHGDVPDYVLSGSPPTTRYWDVLVQNMEQKRKAYLSGLSSEDSE
ncbi:MAG: toll/interleukin-1 receptor domain-containing protein [Clostridia bacterium]|nr:toll/interleukin-1 receptor domain-containing protein [Clostridia bacterium]